MREINTVCISNIECNVRQTLAVQYGSVVLPYTVLITVYTSIELNIQFQTNINIHTV